MFRFSHKGIVQAQALKTQESKRIMVDNAVVPEVI